MPALVIRSSKLLLVVVVAALAISSTVALAASPPLPAATTGAAGSVTYQSALLAASVNPEGSATEVYFQYGTTASYGAVSSSTALAAGTKATPVATAITGLNAYTTYYYRVVAVSSAGKTYGARRTFKTAKIPLSLAIVANPNPVGYDGVVTIEGTLSGTGNADEPVALEQNPYPYTAGFHQLGNTELTTSTGGYSFPIASVALNTQYRVVNVDKPSVVSSVVTEQVMVNATLHSHGVGTRSHPAARFSGTVAPGLETDARIAIEQLRGTNWKPIAGTVTATTPNADGLATFHLVAHFRHGGFFRVLVETVEGSHINGYSTPIIARGY